MINPDLLKLFEHPNIRIVLANQLQTSNPSIMRLSIHSLNDIKLNPNGNIEGRFYRYCYDYMVHVNLNDKVHYSDYIDCIQPSRDRYVAQKQHHETSVDTLSHPYYVYNISRYDVFFLITDTSVITNTVDPHQHYLLVLINLIDDVEYEFHHKVHDDTQSKLYWVEYQHFNVGPSITKVIEKLKRPTLAVSTQTSDVDIEPSQPHQRPKLSISTDCWFANVYRKPKPKVQPEQPPSTFESTWNYIYSSAWNYLSTLTSGTTD